jgi:hypothetical protein
MTFDYARPKATAKRLLARFGQTCTLRKITNIGTGFDPIQEPTDADVTAVDLNQRIRGRDGTLIGQTLRTLYVSTAAGITPEKGDSVAVGVAKASVTSATPFIEIAEVRPLSPGGVNLMWEVDLAE